MLRFVATSLCLSAGIASADPPLPVEFAWFAEGESCTGHAWSAEVRDNADYADCYGSAMLACAQVDDPKDTGYPATFDVEIEAPGTYILWLAATPPRLASSLSVAIDDAEPVDVGPVRVGGWGPSSVFSWLPCARVGLDAGEHTITVRVTGRRQHDNMYYAYLDAVALERVGNDATTEFAAHPEMPDIGPAPIRFYMGNASVGWFMQYWGTGAEGNTGAVDDDTIALLKRCACSSMCDYLAWCRIEEQPGEWDWSFYEANARRLHEAGLQYNTFAWLHFPPRWFMETDDYVPYRNLATGEEMVQQSLWAPYTLELYDDFYRRLAEDFAEPVDSIRLAMPSEYGEIGFATGMTRWLVPDENAKTGYWCGDPHAQASWREAVQRKYGALQAVNEAWGADFESWDALAMPEVADNAAPKRALETRRPEDRRRWLDFVDWYQDSWSSFAAEATRIALRHHPGKEIIQSLGYGAEPVPWGNDQSRHIKRMAEVGAAAQTPGDIGYFPCRRVSTACRVYEVPYYTEPPGNVDRHRQVRRIFMDVSNATQTWFDYPGNLDGARDLLDEYRVHMTGSPAVCDVAFLLPSAWWWCHPDWQWPPRTVAFADRVRDRIDYEVVDELLVHDGALEKLGIRVLVLAEGEFLMRETLEAVREFVESGGVLVLMGVADLQDIDGDSAIFGELCPDAPGVGFSLPGAWQEWGRDVGDGHVLLVPGPDEAALPNQADTLVELTYRLSDLDPARRNAALVDDEQDDIMATLFADRALFYNGTPRFIEKTVHFRPEDFPPGSRRPPQWEMTLQVPAHRIGAISLRQ